MTELTVPARKRSRRSAKQAGSSFERVIANHLQAGLAQPAIDRAPKHGALDRGDIANVRDSHGRLIAVECKNTARINLAGWMREAHAAATNYGAHAGLIIHKRHGTAAPGSQWVTLTVDDLIRLLKEARHE